MTAPENGRDVDRARWAPGLLRTFNDAGVLAAADVHVALRLGRLGGEPDDAVLLAAALAVRAVRAGSVCVELATVAETTTGAQDELLTDVELPWPDSAGWLAACAASPLVAAGPVEDPWRPLRLVDGLLYLDRYWQQEDLVRREFDERVGAAVPDLDEPAVAAALTELFPEPSRQRLAAASMATRRITVLAGGPGTGKTTTVARLLALLHSLPGQAPRIALAAPTGKAAARLTEAVREQAAELPQQHRRALEALSATTVHRLLGVRPDRAGRFRHDRTNRLPHDVVVIDETSMVSVTLMSRLMEALRPDARLLLVGDPDQLASVEAGAVLGDLVARPGRGELPAALTEIAATDLPSDPAELAALRGGVVRLRTVHRFGTEIGALAAAIRDGRADEALEVLQAGSDRVLFEPAGAADGSPGSGLDGVRTDAVAAGQAVSTAAAAGDVSSALALLTSHRLLCAHRQGPYGVARWSTQVQRWLGAPADGGPWFAGQPLLVTRNDDELQLSNGDTGVIIVTPDGRLMAAFSRAQGPLLLSPARLPDVQTLYAMTVHRAQGSQFGTVSLVLPPAESPLLTRELLYTAVTRAVDTVRVIGTPEAVRAGIERRIRRASGLQRVH